MPIFTMFAYLTILACLTVGFVGTEPRRGSQFCEFYNETCGTSGNECAPKIECFPEKLDVRPQCYVVWEYDNATANATIKSKGCNVTGEGCWNQSKCIGKLEHSNTYTCCCEGDMCNGNFTMEPGDWKGPSTLLLVSIILGITFAVLVLIKVVTPRSLCRKTRIRINEEDIPLQEFNLESVRFVEEISQGRVGIVYKAKLEHLIAAVKVFPMIYEQSWRAELAIFELPHMEHDALLRFITAGRKENAREPYTGLWLLTDYHQRGSLCEYINTKILSWPELCKIAQSIARGLMHLHEEIPPNENVGRKPIIAHRDFKSKNVLLKNNMSACIADFDLSVGFPGEASEAKYQVGTPRYMAPEVLMGTITFTPESLLPVDMYACGLVLWEMISRCRLKDDLIANYLLPFEMEVGINVTAFTMRRSVCERQERPLIHEDWRELPGPAAFCEIIERCWHHDPKERLTAPRLLARVTTLTDPLL